MIATNQLDDNSDSKHSFYFYYFQEYFLKNTRLAFVLYMTITTMPGYAFDITAKEKATICASCHGKEGISLTNEVPNLAGQKEAYLIKQLSAFQKGSRVDATMNAMTRSLNKHDIESLASFYSNLSISVTKKEVSQKVIHSKVSRREFPVDTFVTMKKNGMIQSFPDQTIWQGGPDMLFNAVTPDGKILLATSPSSDSVYIFDTKNGEQLAKVKVGRAPKGVKVTPDGKLAYISNQNSANISVIDLQKFTLIDSIKVLQGPHNVRFTKDGKLAYATLQGGAGLAVIDTQSRKMIKVIAVPGITGPHNLDFSLDEKTIFVRDFVQNVAVLDLESEQVKKIVRVGNGHGGIDVSPDGKIIATAAIGDDFISVIDPQSFAVKNIQVGNGPHGIRASRDSRWIYVSVTKDNLVVVINAKTMTVEKKISVGEFPFWIAVQGNP